MLFYDLKYWLYIITDFNIICGCSLQGFHSRFEDMLFWLYQMLLVYTPFKVGPSPPAWDRGREQRWSSKPDRMNSWSSISINKEVDQGNKRRFSDCSRQGKFLSTNKHDHTSLNPWGKVPHCWIFCKKLRKRALHYDHCCLCSVCVCVAEPRPQSNRHTDLQYFMAD